MFTGDYNAKFDRFIYFFYLKSLPRVDVNSLDETGLEDKTACSNKDK